MSKEKIQLPDFVIANLYTDQLVLGADVQLKQLKAETIVDSELKTATTIANPSKVKAIEKQVTISKPIKTDPLIIDTAKQWYLGNNGKQIVVIIKEENVAFINDTHLQFLSNILNACKLNLGDIALLNYINHPLDYRDIKQKLEPKFILIFDLLTKDLQLPFTIPNYQVQSYDNCKFLFAAPFSKMEGNSQDAKMEKSKLWMSLKNMFQL